MIQGHTVALKPKNYTFQDKLNIFSGTLHQGNIVDIPSVKCLV